MNQLVLIDIYGILDPQLQNAHSFKCLKRDLMQYHKANLKKFNHAKYGTQKSHKNSQVFRN